MLPPHGCNRPRGCGRFVGCGSLMGCGHPKGHGHPASSQAVQPVVWSRTAQAFARARVMCFCPGVSKEATSRRTSDDKEECNAKPARRGPSARQSKARRLSSLRRLLPSATDLPSTPPWLGEGGTPRTRSMPALTPLRGEAPRPHLGSQRSHQKRLTPRLCRMPSPCEEHVGQVSPRNFTEGIDIGKRERESEQHGERSRNPHRGYSI